MFCAFLSQCDGIHSMHHNRQGESIENFSIRANMDSRIIKYWLQLSNDRPIQCGSFCYWLDFVYPVLYCGLNICSSQCFLFLCFQYRCPSVRLTSKSFCSLTSEAVWLYRLQNKGDCRLRLHLYLTNPYFPIPL